MHWGLWPPHILQQTPLSSPFQDPHHLQVEPLKSPTSVNVQTLCTSNKMCFQQIVNSTNPNSFIIIPPKQSTFVNASVATPQFRSWAPCSPCYVFIEWSSWQNDSWDTIPNWTLGASSEAGWWLVLVLCQVGAHYSARRGVPLIILIHYQNTVTQRPTGQFFLSRYLSKIRAEVKIWVSTRQEKVQNHSTTRFATKVHGQQ